MTVLKLNLNLLDWQHAGQVPVEGCQLLLLLVDGDRDESRTVSRVVLRHVGAAGVPVADVGVLPVNLSSEALPLLCSVNITLFP